MIFKLNNKKVIQFRARILIALIIINILLIIFLLFFQHSGFLVYLLGGLLVGLSTELYNLRCFEIENSGMVFTIRLFHPLKSGHVFPMSEFPVNALADFSFNNTLFFSLLQLKIKHKDRIVSFRYKIQGLDHKNSDVLQQSLLGIKNELKE